MTDKLPDRFSDAHARAILARAIELDARSPMTTTEELRTIAAELDVSAESLDIALREKATSMEEKRVAGARRAARVVTASGIPLGFAAGAMLSSSAILPALGLTAIGLVASGGLVVWQSSTGSLRSFHLRNIALWGVCSSAVWRR